MVNVLGGDLTAQVLQKALDGQAARGRTIANNISNIDTPNFKGSEVLFEEQLQAALRQPTPHLAMKISNAGHMDPSRVSRDVSNIRPQVFQMAQLTLRNDGNNVDIEREMERLAETQLSVQALVQFMNSRLNKLRMAIREGR